MSTTKPGRVEGKVAFISAAAQGIGAATARALVDQGAQVVLGDIQVDKVKALAEELGGIGLSHDVCSEADWATVVTEVERAHDRLDILVHNAGWAVRNPLWKTSMEDWRKHMQINLESCFIGSNAFMELLKQGAEHHGGTSSIVMVSSIAGIDAAANQVPYNVAKCGVIHLSKCLGIEYGAYGIPIRVNTVVPGMINTAILQGAFEALSEMGELGDGSREEQWQRLIAGSPTNKAGEPSDIANAILYLASDESQYVTSQQIVVDGGLTSV